MIKLQIANSDDLSGYIYFCNYDRIDEFEIFKAVISKISTIPNINIGETKELPYCIIKHCKLGKSLFDIVFDDDYGVFISSESAEVLKQLSEIFENE